MLLKFLWGVVWRCLAFVAVAGAGLWLINQDRGWDAKAAYLAQLESTDTSPYPQVTPAEGRVGVVIMALAMPSQYDPVFFENFIDRLFTKVIPWPINVLAGADAGLALMDPGQPYAPERFEPESLADYEGRLADVDGVPFIEKYRQGLIRWVPPSENVPADTGFFLYPGRKGGMRTPAAKTQLKARYLYHARLRDGYLPHADQTFAMLESAAEQVRAHASVAAVAVADAFNPWQLKQAIDSVLDQGVDTIVFSSAMPIYSDFEEFKGSFLKAHKVLEAWRARNPDRNVQVHLAPMVAQEDLFAQAWLNHLRETLPEAPSAASGLKLILSLHGLPVSQARTDVWMDFHPPIVAQIVPRLEQVLCVKGYRDFQVVDAFEGFADDQEDPDNKLISVAEEIRSGLADGFETVAVLPMEFMAENTDTLFAHAAVMFDGLPGFETYQGPPADVDWTKPYIRTFQTACCQVMYLGALGAANQAIASQALAAAIKRALPVETSKQASLSIDP